MADIPRKRSPSRSTPQETVVGGTKPERFTRDGELILTRRQLIMLHALVDTPDCTAQSMVHWDQLTVPYGKEYTRETAFRMPKGWVTIWKTKRHYRIQLGERGRDILERRVPVYVHGYGPFDRMLRLFRRPWRPQ